MMNRAHDVAFLAGQPPGRRWRPANPLSVSTRPENRAPRAAAVRPRAAHVDARAPGRARRGRSSPSCAPSSPPGSACKTSATPGGASSTGRRWCARRSSGSAAPTPRFAHELGARRPGAHRARHDLSAWEAVFKDEARTSGEAIQTARGPATEEQALHAALLLVAKDQVDGGLDPRRLGHWLRKHADRLIDGKRFVRSGEKTTPSAGRSRIHALTD